MQPCAARRYTLMIELTKALGLIVALLVLGVVATQPVETPTGMQTVDVAAQSDSCPVFARLKNGCVVRTANDNIARCQPGETTANGMCGSTTGCGWNEGAQTSQYAGGHILFCAKRGSRLTGWYCPTTGSNAAICCS